MIRHSFIKVKNQYVNLDNDVIFLGIEVPTMRSTLQETLVHIKKYGITYTILIDKEGIIQHQLVNNLPLGRNIDEAIRTLDALQFHEKNGEVCPANWKPGDDGMKESHEGVADYLKSH